MANVTRIYNLDTFTTRTAAVAQMVNMGVPQNLAKAVVHEHYNYENDGDTTDRLWEMNDDGPVALDCVTNGDLFDVWNTFEDMLSDDEHGIYIDGELLYDINGDHLTVPKYTPSEAYIGMINAIAKYIGDMEELIESEPGEEPVDLEHLNGAYIAERLQSESDAMNEVARLVKARLEKFRSIEPSAGNASIVRGYENGGNFS